MIRNGLTSGRTSKTLAVLLMLSSHLSLRSAPSRLQIGPDNLSALPVGSKVHASVKPATATAIGPEADPIANAPGLIFSKGGIVLPTKGLLTPANGSVEMECCVPEDWPPKGDRALFDATGRTHAHVSMIFRDGKLMAVYKGGEKHFVSIRHAKTALWKPGSWHRIQFSWQAADGDEVDFLVIIDGELSGMRIGRLIDTWPDHCEIGTRLGKRPWKGQLRNIAISDMPLTPPNLEPGQRTITIQGDQPLGDCYRFWIVSNFNQMHKFADPNYGKRYAKASPFTKEALCAYLLGGRYREQNNWFLGIADDGTVQTDFSGMIAQLKGVVGAGFRPRIVLDNVPFNMSNPPQENTYGNTAPPADERVWQQYVEEALRAMIKAFGREKVAGWLFRVGSEPDLNPSHWAGTKAQYFDHYDHTVAAVLNVLPEARIGPGHILNPASAKTNPRPGCFWGLDIIDHAATGSNAVTGGTGTKMDCFGWSWYGWVGQPLTVFDEAVNLVRKRLERYPQYAELPLFLGEFAVLHDERGRRLWGGDTTEWSASFYAAVADRVYKYNILQVYEWARSTGGVPHPRKQVIRMLDWMTGGRRLAVDVQAESSANCGAIACRKDGDVYVLAYNHRPLRRPSVSETVHLVLRDSRMEDGSQWSVSEWRIDARHAAWAHAFRADCKAAGVEQRPKAGNFEGSVERLYGQPGLTVFRRNRDKYLRLATLPKTRDSETIPAGAGQLSVDFEMPGHSVRLLKFSISKD